MTAPRPGFTHAALFYTDLAEFLAGTVPFLRESVAAGEPALVAVEPGKSSALRAALPDADGLVRFADMTALGRNPGRIISAWADFVHEHGGARRLRGVGEPVWHGRSREEIVECQRHEALLNLAFADQPGFHLICPYDRKQLDGSVLDEARSSHPLLVQDGERTESFRYESHVAPYEGSLPEPPSDVEQLFLAAHRLAEVRRHVTDAALAAGVGRERAGDLAMAATEAATNSLRHAGGQGVLRTWHENGSVVCEVRDRGRIEDPLAGRLPVPTEEPGGRGLWLIHQLCDLVQIRSSGTGTVVRMHLHG